MCGGEQGWAGGCMCIPMYTHTHTEREEAAVDSSFPCQILEWNLKYVMIIIFYIIYCVYSCNVISWKVPFQLIDSGNI